MQTSFPYNLKKGNGLLIPPGKSMSFGKNYNHPQNILRLTLVSMRNSVVREKFNFCFSTAFCWY